MKIFKILALLVFLSLFSNLYGQKTENSSFSIFTGGMLLKRSALSTTKLGYEINHLGMNIDYTYDGYHETWNDGSKSNFKITSLSLSGRYYVKPAARGLFGELGFGPGNPVLTNKENNVLKEVKETLPLVGFGLGWRFRKSSRRIFGEIGFRSTTSLKEAHLYTTTNRPDTKEDISYQSWLFEKGKLSSQIYLGIGYSF